MKRSITDYTDHFPTVQPAGGHNLSQLLLSSLLPEVLPLSHSARPRLTQMLPPMFFAIELYSYDSV